MTVQELNAVIGRNITFYRKQKGWYIRQLAKKIGVSETTVSYHEHGHVFPSAGYLLMYSLVLEVEVWQLFTMEFENATSRTLGEVIKYHREKKGLSQRDIAKKIGITPGAVSCHESNQYIPAIEQLKKYADIFDVEVSQLFAEIGKRRLIVQGAGNDKCA